MTVAAWILALSLLLLAYTYAGYPLLLWLLSKLRPRPVRRGTAQPKVAFVVVGHNEAKRLAAKLDTCLKQDYPADRLRVVVASDGSTDDTPGVVQRYGDARVQLLSFPQRRGKAACLNDAVAACSEEIIVFTDARQALHPQAVALLVANFADAGIGAASGELVFVQDDPTAFAQGVDAYWRYEKFIRHHEALTGSVVGVTGALYAMRRACFRPIPPQTILDDVAIPMLAAMEGRRIVFEKGAIAYDQPSAEAAQEKRRKVRTLAGNFQLVSIWPQMLLPWRNPLFMRFVSHKMLRLAAPAAMLAALLSNAVLALGSSAMGWLFAAQLACYLLPLAGRVFPPLMKLLPVKLGSAFLSLNAFVVLGLVEFLGNKDAHIWKQDGKQDAAHNGGAPGKLP